MVPSIANSQEARRVQKVSKKEETLGSREEAEEEARKKELRRFVREKWKRIRELESQSSPGSSSTERERRGARASSVEYDPDNPFDDDKNRTQRKTETSKVSATIKKKTSGTNVSNALLGQKDACRVKDKHSVKSALEKGHSVQRKDRPVASTSNDLKKERMHVKGDTAKFTERSKKEGLVKTKVSSEITITRPQKIDSESRVQGAERAVPASIPTIRAEAAAIPKEEQEDHPAKQRADTPIRRRKRRSEVAHYQPSAVVSLSTDTSNALAELEASLARLKAHSDKAASARKRTRSPLSLSPNNKDCDSRKTEDPSRSRRSLSPAKEMRQMQLEQERKRGDAEVSPPRVSFLQRIEQKREEVESASASTRQAAKRATIHTKDFANNSITQGEPYKKKVIKRYSYTPTQRQPEAGTINRGGVDDIKDESSCSIVIGDESIDDIIRHGKSTKFLATIRVFVDVRDQDGEDASSGWIEKLKSVGARVYSKIPSSITKVDSQGSSGIKKAKLTHIVYKNGRPSTLHYLRAMVGNQSNGSGEPAPPIVVGVNWILECLQQGGKVDEKGFLVEVGKQAVFNKPRTSMTSKRAPQSSANRSSPQNMAELLAKKKTIQNAPAQPSPLARRCWNMDASTSSSISAATSYALNDGL